MQRFFFQSGALAFGASYFVHKGGGPAFDARGATFVVLVFDEIGYAFKINFVFFGHAQGF